LGDRRGFFIAIFPNDTLGICFTFYPAQAGTVPFMRPAARIWFKTRLSVFWAGGFQKSAGSYPGWKRPYGTGVGRRTFYEHGFHKINQTKSGFL
jgi:hypothetical protein